MNLADNPLKSYREPIRHYLAQCCGGYIYEKHSNLCLEETFMQAEQMQDTPAHGWEAWLQQKVKATFILHLHQFLAENVSYYFTPLYILFESSVRYKVELTLGSAKSVEATNDCMQITFERVFKTLQGRKPEDILRLEHLKGWLNEIAEHVVFEWKHKHPQKITTPMPGTKARFTLTLESIEREIGERGERSDVLDAGTNNQPEAMVEKEEIEQEVRAYVALLPEKYRISIQLHFFDELKLEQIAEKLNLSLSAIKTYIKRGKSMLHDYVRVKWAVDDDAQQVQTHIERLKDPHRCVLRLHFIESKDLPDVANFCKRSLDSVRRYLYYGAKIIAAYVKPESAYY